MVKVVGKRRGRRRTPSFGLPSVQPVRPQSSQIGVLGRFAGAGLQRGEAGRQARIEREEACRSSDRSRARLASVRSRASVKLVTEVAMLSGRGASEDDQVNGGRVVGGMLFDEAIVL